MVKPLCAPFPWFGGKSRAAGLIWARLGDVDNYVEPFAGSLAVLLGRPHAPRIETVNDLDGFVCNAWRAMRDAPEETARHATNPVNECDLHARHSWLVANREDLSARLMGDPEFCDAKLAGWWLWGVSCWIGSGFCSGEGPWSSQDGRLVRGDAGRGVNKQMPHLGTAGRGVKRQMPHLGDWFGALSRRLAGVRVCCGDWGRVMGPCVTAGRGLTGVVLDPPYSAEAGRYMRCYAKDSGDVAHACRAWCVAHGGAPRLRIALCGYEGEGHEELERLGWSCVAWKAQGGMSSQGDGANPNKHRERVWFSPACLGANLFDHEEAAR